MVDLMEELFEAERAELDLRESDNGKVGETSDGFPIHEVKLDRIENDPNLQSRQGLNDETLEEYTQLLEQGHRFPPVVVFAHNGKYVLADGFHRFEAHKRACMMEIRVEVREGDKRAALLYSVGANGKHGLRRTNEDKRRAVDLLLADPEWREWSSSRIADICAVSDKFVSIRKVATSNGSESSVVKTVRNGRTVTMDIGNIGPRAKVVAEPKLEPDLEQEKQIAQVKKSSTVSSVNSREELKAGMQALLAAIDREVEIGVDEIDGLIIDLVEQLTRYQKIIQAI